MLTTREKLHALADELGRTPPSEISEESRGLVELVQMANGFGIDLWGAIIPESDAEADLMIDQLIGLLLNLRGEDLPPFDLARYGEVMETDDA